MHLENSIIPKSRGLPLVGNIFPFLLKPADFLVRERRRLGDVFELALGPVSLVVIGGHNSAVKALKNRHLKKEVGTTKLLKGFMADGLGFSDGDLWRSQRINAQRAFSSKSDMLSQDKFSQIVEEEFSQLESQTQIEPLSLFTRITFSYVCDLLFNQRLSREWKIRNSDALVNILSRANITRWLTSLPSPFSTLALERFHKITSSLRSDVAMLVEGGCFNRELLSPKSQAEGNTSLAIEEIITFLVAAVENSAVTTSWLAAHLAQNPLLQVECQREISEGNPSTLWLSEGTEDLPLLVASIKETLRLTPPSFFISRSVIEETRLDEFILKANTLVAISPLLVGRDPRYWVDPGSFRPRRWQHPKGRKENLNIPFSPQELAWIPFGAGPRNCVGFRLGILMITAISLYLLKNFEIRIDERNLKLVKSPRETTVYRPDLRFRLQLQRRI